MLELTALAAFIGYIVYLRYYADQRSNAQKEADRLREGIDLYASGQLAAALTYFNAALENQPKSSVAYLYRARILRDLGDPAAALTDLERGKSYDDTIADLHLETGRIYFGRGDYERAFLDFDKAVFHNGSQQPEPYRWRGLAGQRLHRDELSRSDLERADTLEKETTVVVGPPVPGPFFDRRLVLHMGLVVISAVLLLLIVKRSTVIHLSYFTAAVAGVSIGFLEPRKGWVLALQQALLLWLGYVLIAGPATAGRRQDLENFGLYGSIALTFVGSFLGGIIRRGLGSSGQPSRL